MGKVIVGKKGDQPFPITDNTVSREHVAITDLEDGKVLVEDLGSKNGTYYKGQRITKMEIPVGETIKLGKFDLKLSDVFVRNEKFERLSEIWEKYSKEKLAIQKKYYKKNFMRSVPAYLLAVVGFVCNILPSFDEYRVYVAIVGIVLVGIIAMMSYKSVGQYPEEMEALKQQFKIDYVCPKCNRYLGEVPFKGLRNQRICNLCKTQWV